MRKLLFIYLKLFMFFIIFISSTNGYATDCSPFFVAGESFFGDNLRMILLSSPDGKNWSPVPLTVGVRDVVKGDHGYLATGWCFSPIRSLNGDTWKEVRSINADCFNRVSWTNDRYFVSGGIGEDDFASLYSSVDGKDFTLVYIKENAPKITNVVYGNGRYIAVGEGEEGSLFSYDGMTWSKLPPYDIGALTFDGKQFVAINSQGTVGISMDGFVWKLSHVNASINYLIWVDTHHQYVAVGNNGKILTSEDAEHWILQSSGTSKQLNKVTWTNGLYLAVGADGTILTSKNGYLWKKQNSHSNFSLTGVA